MESEHATSWPYKPIGVYDVMQLQDTCQVCRSKIEVETIKDFMSHIKPEEINEVARKIEAETRQRCWEDVKELMKWFSPVLQREIREKWLGGK